MSENLKFWNSVERTDPSFTKKVSYGQRSFTTIDAYYQIKTATEKFGMFGDGWGTTVEKFTFHESLLVYEAVFFYTINDKKFEFPIASSIIWKNLDKNGRVRVDDECVKKVKTDALTKAFSFLGINADVFLGRFDDNRYVNQLKKEFNEKPKPKPTAKEVIDLLLKSMNVEEAREFCIQVVGKESSSEWTSDDIQKIYEKIKQTEES